MKNMSPEHKKWTLTGALLLVLGFNVSIHHFQKDEFGVAILDSQALRGLYAESGVIELAATAPGTPAVPPADDVEKGLQESKTESSDVKAAGSTNPAATEQKSGDVKVDANKDEVKSDNNGGVQASEADKDKAAKAKAAKAKAAKAKADKGKAAKAKAAKAKVARAKSKVEQGEKPADGNLADQAVDDGSAAKAGAGAGTSVAGATAKSDGVAKPDAVTPGRTETFEEKLNGKEVIVKLTANKDDPKKTEASVTFKGCDTCEAQTHTMNMDLAGIMQYKEYFMLAFSKLSEGSKKDNKPALTAAETKAADEKTKKEAFKKILEECKKEKSGDDIEEVACRSEKMIALFESNQLIEDKDKQIETSKFTAFFRTNIGEKLARQLVAKDEDTGVYMQTENTERAVELIGQLVKDLPDKLESSRSLLVKLSGGVVKKLGNQYQEFKIAQSAYKAGDSEYRRLEGLSRDALLETRMIGNSLGEAIQCGLNEHFTDDSTAGQRKLRSYMASYNGTLNKVGAGLQNPLTAGSLADRNGTGRKVGRNDDPQVRTSAGARRLNPNGSGAKGDPRGLLPGAGITGNAAVAFGASAQIGGGRTSRFGNENQFRGNQFSFSGTQAGVVGNNNGTNFNYNSQLYKSGTFNNNGNTGLRNGNTTTGGRRENATRLGF